MIETQTQTVPFLALGGLFEQDDVDAAQQVIGAVAEENGSFFPLPEENDFQNALAEHEGAAKAVGVNACGTALDLCMMALGVGPGDEVITTPLTFVCTATCASVRGAKVVFADIDQQTLCLDPAKVREKITSKTKAIIPVHFAGHACDVHGFERITQDTGVPVIYDAAHAVGTKHRGKPIGGAGLASCYSFQSNKNMTTLGEGGAITSNDTEFAEHVRQMKTFGYVYGGPGGTRVVTQGFNYRLTKPQLAVGLTQLTKIDQVNRLKRDRARRLHEQLEDVEGLIRPAGIDDDHAMHLYVIRIDSTVHRFERQTFRDHLKNEYQVGTALHYPVVWSWDAFENDGIAYDGSNCETAERACREVVSMPVFPSSTDQQMDYLAWAVRQTLEDLSQ